MIDLSNVNEVRQTADNIRRIRGEYMLEKVRNKITCAVLAGRDDTTIKLTEPSGVRAAYRQKIIAILDEAGYMVNFYGYDKLYIAWGEQECKYFNETIENLRDEENERKRRKREDI